MTRPPYDLAIDAASIAEILHIERRPLREHAVVFACRLEASMGQIAAQNHGTTKQTTVNAPHALFNRRQIARLVLRVAGLYVAGLRVAGLYVVGLRVV